MKILITGCSGQLGQALLLSRPTFLVDRAIELIPCTRADLDLADANACKNIIQSLRPDWVINAGAYTAVDKAETESELAYAVNAAGPKALAGALASTGGRMLQISTDFVFDGRQSVPYETCSAVCPLGVYGASKAVGEQAVLDELVDRAFVLRTSWVYGPVGRNFVLTMLKLIDLKASAGETLAVVADQVGSPTSTDSLASTCWKLIAQLMSKNTFPSILHWSDSGVASWYDFAVAIGEIGFSLGLLDNSCQIRPITTAEYPTPAQRPSYSLLDCSNTK